jgi:hypothetical protein
LTDPESTDAPKLVYDDTGGLTPFVYFDIIGAHGIMNGAIQIELPGAHLGSLDGPH